MFRNVLAATLSNLARNRLYTAISIGGLAVAMAVALLTALFVREELTFDRFLPGSRSLYVVAAQFDNAAMNHQQAAYTPLGLAAQLKQAFPQIKTTARYFLDGDTVTRGEVEAVEKVGWVDPDFFELFPLKTLAGDLKSAVRRPDGMVLTRAMARKYFGAENPIGQSLTLERKTPFRVMAVVEDLPDNSSLSAPLFASALAPMSHVAQVDAKPDPVGVFNSATRTFMRLENPRDVEAINRRLPAFVDTLFPPSQGPRSLFAVGLKLFLLPVADLHLFPEAFGEVPAGNLRTIGALAAIASLILLIAGINFVNLMTARASRRAIEIGVRKTAGAERGHLVLQFIGEALVFALFSLLFAHALVELFLPGLNALLERKMHLDYLQDPAMLAVTAGIALLLGLGAGVYPALVLSAFRPREVLKGPAAQKGGSSGVRAALVCFQFAALIGLLLSVTVIARQTNFAMNKAIGLDTDRMLRVFVQCYPPEAYRARTFVARVAALPGVAGIACADGASLGAGSLQRTVVMPDGRSVNVSLAPTGFGFFELYGARPLAGRLPSPAFTGDSTVLPGMTTPPSSQYAPNEVINAAMARGMGFTRPADAIGAVFRVRRLNKAMSDPLTVIGVVSDVRFDLTKGDPTPIMYSVDPPNMRMLSVKLRAGSIPETVAAIDRLWKEHGDPRPISRQFTDEFLNLIYVNTIRQAWLIGALATIAIFIGGLGLFGLAAFTAERRTKEIGVRKAMGASSPDIVRLLLWSFTQPVLWANLIAWPVAGWSMSQWLQSFSARISLSPLYFLAAGAAALTIAALTVSAHAIRVARAKPVGALRYE
jgi:putative ABC transport system permease protein